MVRQVATGAELHQLLREAGGKLVVVDFFAEWCGPCKFIAPLVEKMEGEHANVVFLKVDVDRNAEAAREYGISAMPTFKLVKSGAVVAEVRGADPNALLKAIERHETPAELPGALPATLADLQSALRERSQSTAGSRDELVARYLSTMSVKEMKMAVARHNLDATGAVEKDDFKKLIATAFKF